MEIEVDMFKLKKNCRKSKTKLDGNPNIEKTFRNFLKISKLLFRQSLKIWYNCIENPKFLHNIYI